MKHESGVIGICIADGRDHDKLISSLMRKILDRFYQIFKKDVDVMAASLLGKTDKFGKEVDAILKHKFVFYIFNILQTLTSYCNP